jgi:hypothetical protein
MQSRRFRAYCGIRAHRKTSYGIAIYDWAEFQWWVFFNAAAGGKVTCAGPSFRGFRKRIARAFFAKILRSFSAGRLAHFLRFYTYLNPFNTVIDDWIHLIKGNRS